MNEEITANPNVLLWQETPLTMHDLLRKAVESIDQTFGEGFAKAHPELVGAMVQASAIDRGTAIIAQMIEQLALSMDDLTKAVQHIIERMNVAERTNAATDLGAPCDPGRLD